MQLNLKPPNGYGLPVFSDKNNHYWEEKFIPFITANKFVNITQKELDYVVNMMISELEKYIVPTHVYTLEEIISGIEGIKDSLNQNTSPGFPFKKHYTKKRDFLEDRNMIALLELQWNDWLTEQPIAMPITMSSKDEILPTEKLHKPRPFYVVDVATTINGKRLCDDFNNQMSKVPFFYVGKDFFRGGMKEMINEHAKYTYHLCKDKKGNDYHRQPWMSEMMIRLRWHFMKDKTKANYERLVSFYSVLDQSECIDLLSRWWKKFYQQPTGGPNTLHDNSIIAWAEEILIFTRYFGVYPDYAKKYLGDDTVNSFNNYVDPIKLQQMYLDIGVEITSSDKTKEGFYKKLNEIEFLKATPNFLGKHIVPKYDLERLKSILYFRKSDDGTYEEKINQVLKLSYGTDLYYHLRKVIPYTNFDKSKINDRATTDWYVLGLESKSVGLNNLQTTEIKLAQSKMQQSQNNENPIDFDAFSNQNEQSEVQTLAPVIKNQKKSFIEKCVHPPSAVEFLGLPTNDTRSQVTLEWRNVNFMKTPVVATGPAFANANNVTNIAYLITNGARINSIAFANVNDRWYQDVANTDQNTLYDFTRFRGDAQLYRIAAKSTTTYLNATMFNNTGGVCGSQFNPSILFAGPLYQMAEQKPQAFIKLIVQLVKSKRVKMYDYDTPEYDKLMHGENKKIGTTACWSDIPMYIIQEINSQLRTVGELPGIDPATLFQVLNFGQTLDVNDFVPDISQTMQQDQRSYFGKAMEGTFTVQKLNSLSPAWKTSSQPLDPENNKGLYNCAVYCVGPTGVAAYIFLDDPSNKVGDSVSTAKILQDTLWTEDMTFAWVQYSGLSYNALAFPATTAQQILIKKYYTVFEVQPAPTSPWSAMIKLGPEPDMKAMEQCLKAFYELKDCMPARYNFWGTLLKAGLPILKSIGGKVFESLTSGLNEHSDAVSDLVEEAGTHLKMRKTKQKIDSEVKEAAAVAKVEKKVERKVEHKVEKKLEKVNNKGRGNPKKNKKPLCNTCHKHHNGVCRLLNKK